MVPRAFYGTKAKHWVYSNVGSRLVWWFWLIKSLGKIILNPAIDLMVLINKKFVPGESQIAHTNSLSCSCHAPTTTTTTRTTTTTTILLPLPHQLKNIIWILISRGYGLLKSLAQIIQFLHIVLGVRFIRKFGPRNFQIWKNCRRKTLKQVLPELPKSPLSCITAKTTTTTTLHHHYTTSSYLVEKQICFLKKDHKIAQVLVEKPCPYLKTCPQSIFQRDNPWAA